MDPDELRKAIEPLTAAVRSLSEATPNTAAIERLALALVGEDVGALSYRLDEIGKTLNYQCEALDRIANSLEDLADKMGDDE